jgi:DNA-binding transcriptional LysR family regulator
MAAAGIGVAMIPSLCTVSTRPDIVVRPLRGRPPMRHILAAVRAGERDPIVDSFLEGLRAAAQSLPVISPRLAAVA